MHSCNSPWLHFSFFVTNRILFSVYFSAVLLVISLMVLGLRKFIFVTCGTSMTIGFFSLI